jgi:hypothetical protein
MGLLKKTAAPNVGKPHSLEAPANPYIAKYWVLEHGSGLGLNLCTRLKTISMCGFSNDLCLIP